MAVYCKGCIWYGGRPSGEGEDDYKGDRCRHPTNMEYINSYYSPATQHYISYPASINEDNDCANFSNGSYPEE